MFTQDKLLMCYLIHLPSQENDIGNYSSQILLLAINYSGANIIISLKNIMPLDIGSGQGLEII